MEILLCVLNVQIFHFPASFFLCFECKQDVWKVFRPSLNLNIGSWLHRNLTAIISLTLFVGWGKWERRNNFPREKARALRVWKISSTFYVSLINMRNLLYELLAAWNGDLNSICHSACLASHLWLLDGSSICERKSPETFIFLSSAVGWVERETL